MTWYSRRRLLQGVAGVGTVGLAGCSGESSDDDGNTNGTEPQDETPENESDTEKQPTDAEIKARLFPDYETTDVTVTTDDGEQLAELTAAIAETSEQWQVGLSETDSLPEDWGMLFVSESVSYRSFWMKGMDFGLDIIFVDDEKRIKAIDHAPEPDPGEGEEQRYRSQAQYILEVNYKWADRNDVSEGDVLQFER